MCAWRAENSALEICLTISISASVITMTVVAGNGAAILLKYLAAIWRLL
jgi:hypothetical protein